jgi:hypothetical protein
MAADGDSISRPAALSGVKRTLIEYTAYPLLTQSGRERNWATIKKPGVRPGYFVFKSAIPKTSRG